MSLALFAQGHACGLAVRLPVIHDKFKSSIRYAVKSGHTSAVCRYACESHRQSGVSKKKLPHS
jgi:predicted ATPase